MAKLLPRITPVIDYLHDAVASLNLAIHNQASPEWHVRFFARSSSMHSIASMHAAINAALYSEDHGWEPSQTLKEKFDLYLVSRGLDPLENNEIAHLDELDLVSGILSNPSPAQAADMPHPEKKNLISFPRTPMRRFNCEPTTWPIEYAGATLGLVVTFLNRFFLQRCGFDAEKVEVIFGTHAHSDDTYVTTLDETKIKRIRGEQKRLLADRTFITKMASDRWRFSPNDFVVRLFDPDASQPG